MSREKHESKAIIIGVAIAIVLGFILRAIHVLSTDFPLNDGGLFYIMVQELQSAHYRLPDFTFYNARQTPFAYPPLALYLAGLIQDITGAPLIQIFRFLPLIVTTAIIGAFASFAHSLLRTHVTIVIAVFAFVFIPRTFVWLLMGGGLTRALGFLFTILALDQIYKAFIRRRSAHVAAGTLFCGLTVLSHLGTVAFLALSIVLLFLFYGRHRFGVLSCIAIALGTLIMTSPWWGTVVAVHGIAPFLAAQATGVSIFSGGDATRSVVILLAHLGVGNSAFGITGEALFPLIGCMAFLGALSSLAKKEWFLVTWWLVTIVFELRAGATYASIPIAMLAAIGITDTMSLLGAPVAAIAQAFSLRRRSWSNAIRSQGVGILILSVVLFYAAVSSILKHPGSRSELKYLVSLSPEERRAMQVASLTPLSSRFLVMPENPWGLWGADKTSEWFPALSGHASVATVQGTEWISGKLFRQSLDNWKLLAECDNFVARCLDDRSQAIGEPFTHVYIPQPTVHKDFQPDLCCKLLIQSLRKDARYQEIYSGPGAVIFARQP